jgi:hypothetical protein
VELRSFLWFPVSPKQGHCLHILRHISPPI